MWCVTVTLHSPCVAVLIGPQPTFYQALGARLETKAIKRATISSIEVKKLFTISTIESKFITLSPFL